MLLADGILLSIEIINEADNILTAAACNSIMTKAVAKDKGILACTANHQVITLARIQHIIPLRAYQHRTIIFLILISTNLPRTCLNIEHNIIYIESAIGKLHINLATVGSKGIKAILKGNAG